MAIVTQKALAECQMVAFVLSYNVIEVIPMCYEVLK